MPLSQKSINFGGLRIKVDSFALDVLACELSMSMSLDMASIFHLLLFVMLLLFVVGVFFPCLCSPWPNVQPAGLEGGHIYTLLILGEARVCTKVSKET